MAEGQEDTERSEDPTQKRLDEALERGDVVKSQEVNTWFVIAGGALLLMAFSGPMASGLTTTLRGLVAHSGSIRVDGRGFSVIVEKLGVEIVAAVAIPLATPYYPVCRSSSHQENMNSPRFVFAIPLKPQIISKRWDLVTENLARTLRQLAPYS